MKNALTKIPMSCILGSGAEAPAQSQDLEKFAITLIKAIPPLFLKYLTILEAASPIADVKSN